MELWAEKILYMLGIAVVAFSGGLLPFLFKRFRIANACAGGIFLSVGFCHMLADGIEALEDFEGEGKPLGEFPLALCLMGVGGLIILFVEKVLLSPESHALGHGGSGHHHHDHHHEHDEPCDHPHHNHEDARNALLDDHERCLSHSDPSTNAPGLETVAVDVVGQADGSASEAAHVSVIGCVVLVLALGVHSFIEGLALGVTMEEAEALRP